VTKHSKAQFATVELILERSLLLQVKRAARALGRRFDEALRPFEITNGQFLLLMLITATEPATMSDLAAELAMDRTTLTAAFKPLVRRNLLAISKNDSDSRARKIALTLEGRDLLDSAVRRWDDCDRIIEALISTGNRLRLCEDLRLLSGGFDVSCRL
jgi:DNA-binding MarR family transcriptional regulator